jgi:hypothetical protein
MVQAPLPGHIWRVTQPGWTESGATWNRDDGVRAWTTPGGDVDAASGIPFAPPTAPGSFAFPDLTPLCQDAIAARGGHLDLLIRQDSETPGTPPHQWSFVMVGDGPSPEMRPSLVVTFSGGAGSGPSTTSSPTTTTSPTSTTLPTCSASATFSSLTCRLSVLAAQLDVEVTASTFRARLLTSLQGRVLQNVQQAEQFASSGDNRRARVRLRHAQRGLADFVQRLNSAKGRKAVAQSVGQTMGNEALAIRKAIHDLAGSLR